MKNAVKFTFDTHFGGDVPASGNAKSDARSRKSYSVEDIEAMKREAREEGRRDGDVRATQAVAASIGQVAAAMMSAIDAMDGEIERIRAESAALAFAAAKSLARAALDASPEPEIAEMLQVAFHQAVGEPRVVVTTAPGLAERIQERADTIAQQEGYEGRTQFVADRSLNGADCRIEWRGGGIERAQAALESQLAELIARRFPGAGLKEHE